MFPEPLLCARLVPTAFQKFAHLSSCYTGGCGASETVSNFRKSGVTSVVKQNGSLPLSEVPCQEPGHGHWARKAAAPGLRK